MKEKMLRAAREKGRVTHKGKPIRLTADLLAETLQARREWGPTFNILKEKNFQPRISYPAKLSFISEGKIKFFADKQVLRDYINTRPALQELLKEALHMDGNNQYQPFQKHTKRCGIHMDTVSGNVAAMLRQDLAMLPRLEGNGVIMTHCSLKLLGSSHPLASASLVAVTTETGSCYVAQADLECLTSSHPPALVSQSAEIPGMSLCTWPSFNLYPTDTSCSDMTQSSGNTYLHLLVYDKGYYKDEEMDRVRGLNREPSNRPMFERQVEEEKAVKETKKE
ncbi:LINE-1 retrotransposable element ORF1 protein [Plecturocebus cupreus]